jgi:D-alanyl-D-alanine carboxypeptidase (penicillin-binding protein 5/6)
MISNRRRRNGEDAPLAILIVVVVLAAVFAFYRLGPLSSSSDTTVTVQQSNEQSDSADSSSKGGSESSSLIDDGSAPPISALSAAVVDGDCGNLLYDKDSHRRLPPASTTKIATAIVATETSDPNEMVRVDIDNFYFGDSTVMGLETGMTLSLRDLLYGLLLPSGNDAAVTIARHIAGDVPSFVNRMNAKVRDLGLEDTHFTNPHGLDSPSHYSSAYDLAMLGRYAMKNELIAEIVKTKQYQPKWDGPELWNGNLLLWLYPNADGVKIGWTEKAGQTMVATAERDGRRLYVALMGSQDRYTDAIWLFDWAFENFPKQSCSGESVSADTDQ